MTIEEAANKVADILLEFKRQRYLAYADTSQVAMLGDRLAEARYTDESIGELEHASG